MCYGFSCAMRLVRFCLGSLSLVAVKKINICMYICLYLRKGEKPLVGFVSLWVFLFHVVCLAKDLFFLPERMY